MQAALAEGRLDEERLESWRKLEREQEFVRRKIDPADRPISRLTNLIDDVFGPIALFLWDAFSALVGKPKP